MTQTQDELFNRIINTAIELSLLRERREGLYKELTLLGKTLDDAEYAENTARGDYYELLEPDREAAVEADPQILLRVGDRLLGAIVKVIATKRAGLKSRQEATDLNQRYSATGRQLKEAVLEYAKNDIAKEDA